MKNLIERIKDVSGHLQTLAAPEFSKEIELAVEKNDKTSVIQVCRRANIPQRYIGTVTSIIFSVSPSKWPDNF